MEGPNQGTVPAKPGEAVQLTAGVSPVHLRDRANAPLTFEVADVMARTLLDKIQDRFSANPADADAAMYDLQDGLRSVKSISAPEVWMKVAAECRRHPLGASIWQDPFTHHSYSKPLGYSGDAQLLDYLYGLTPAPGTTSFLGKGIFNHMMAQQGALSVRWRARLLARLIDQTAEQKPNARILSIACGHFREGVGSSAIRQGRLGEFVAFDQDGASLSQIARNFAGTKVRTVAGSVRDILAGKTDFVGFDFVYAAGLYDYLSDRVASRLTRIMFDMLAPGGRLLVANFAPVLPEVAYMESFMDWTLIYRTAEQMAAVTSEISGDAWQQNHLFFDDYQNVIYQELIKRPTAPANRFTELFGDRFSFAEEFSPSRLIDACVP